MINVPAPAARAGTLVHRGQEHLDALVHAGVIEEEDGHCGCLGGEVYRLVSDPDRAQVALAADPEDPTPIAAVVAAAAAFDAVLSATTVTEMTVPELKEINRLQKALAELANPARPVSPWGPKPPSEIQ